MTESNNNQASFSDTEMDDEILAKKLYRLESEIAQIKREINSGKKRFNKLKIAVRGN